MVEVSFRNNRNTGTSYKPVNDILFTVCSHIDWFWFLILELHPLNDVFQFQGPENHKQYPVYLEVITNLI